MNTQDIRCAEGANDRAIARHEEQEAWIDEGYRDDCHRGKSGDWIEWIDQDEFARKAMMILNSFAPADECFADLRSLFRESVEYATQRHSEVVVRNGRK